MHPVSHFSRRSFIIRTAAAVTGVALGLSAARQSSGAAEPQDPILTPVAYLPMVQMAPLPKPPPGRVIHVYAASAVSWTGQSDYYNYLHAPTVTAMVNRGLRELTGASDIANAWRTLIPGYRSGQKIAIKVNFNNNNSAQCGLGDEPINGLIEPVNAVVDGLEKIGVARSDIWVYDAVRTLSDRFVAKALPGTRFFGKACREPATFTDLPANRIAFSHPAGVVMPKELVTDVLMQASYLINMPIMKGSHALAGVTLGFKNHFGTIDRCSDLHNYADVVGTPPGYRSDYNSLVDLMRSPLIGGKTALTIGDGLFAAKHWLQMPQPWVTFDNNVPKSLFFSTDPVAIDCVMHDFLAAEPGIGVVSGANNYLKLAAGKGLGVFESANPWTGSYSSIDYRRIELPSL